MMRQIASPGHVEGDGALARGRLTLYFLLSFIVTINYADRISLSVGAAPIAGEFHISPVGMGFLFSCGPRSAGEFCRAYDGLRHFSVLVAKPISQSAATMKVPAAMGADADRPVIVQSYSLMSYTNLDTIQHILHETRLTG
jgi:hypothetical protein